MNKHPIHASAVAVDTACTDANRGGQDTPIPADMSARRRFHRSRPVPPAMRSGEPFIGIQAKVRFSTNRRWGQRPAVFIALEISVQSIRTNTQAGQALREFAERLNSHSASERSLSATTAR